MQYQFETNQCIILSEAKRGIKDLFSPIEFDILKPENLSA